MYRDCNVLIFKGEVVVKSGNFDINYTGVSRLAFRLVQFVGNRDMYHIILCFLCIYHMYARYVT